MPHLMKPKFSLILVESKPRTFQLNLQSKQTSLGSLILITQWIFSCTCTSLSVCKIFSAGTEVFTQLCFKAPYRGGSAQSFRECLQMPYHFGRGGWWAGGRHFSKAARNHPNRGKRSNKSFKDLLLQRKALSSLLACPESGALLEYVEMCLLYEGTFH